MFSYIFLFLGLLSCIIILLLSFILSLFIFIFQLFFKIFLDQLLFKKPKITNTVSLMVFFVYLILLNKCEYCLTFQILNFYIDIIFQMDDIIWILSFKTINRIHANFFHLELKSTLIAYGAQIVIFKDLFGLCNSYYGIGRVLCALKSGFSLVFT